MYGKYWRGAEDLIAKIDFIIPPKSQSKIQIKPIPSLLNQGIQGDFAFISGQQKQDATKFKTAYGTATLKPEWVQLANLTESPILIKKGEIVGQLHPREQAEVAQAKELDVNAGDLEHEKKIKAEAAKARIRRDAQTEEHSRQAFVRLTTKQHDDDLGKEHINKQEFQPDWCTCCERTICKARTVQENLLWDEKKEAIAKLGINIQDTANQTTQCELEKLVDFCLTQDKVINSHGKLSPERVIPHNTALSFELTETPHFKARPQKSTPQTKVDIEQMVKEKLEQGIIEKSSAPWSSNCVVIRKDGKTRIAVDYRKLNSITVKDSYMLPKIAEIFDALHGTTWFTLIDCTQAYHQLPMRTEQDKDLTTFVAPSGGLYRYKYMPFGLANAGACWSRFIDDAMAGLRWQTAMVYADDILIYSKGTTVEGHIGHLQQVFERLAKYGITVKGSKVRLGLKELPYLGQIISTKGCRPDPAKTKAITELASPESIGQLRRVVGMFAHYKKFIPNYSNIAAPLYAMTGKNNQIKRGADNRFVMTEEQNRSFQTLKAFLNGDAPLKFTATQAKWGWLEFFCK